MDYFVSYKRHEDERFTSTNIVHVEDETMENRGDAIYREFGGCAWFSAVPASEGEIRSAKAKGMPERWL